jgi:hypothetical protein
VPAFPVLAHESCSWKGCGTVVITRGLCRLLCNPLLIAVTVVVGLIAFLLLQPIG